MCGIYLVLRSPGHGRGRRRWFHPPRSRPRLCAPRRLSLFPARDKLRPAGAQPAEGSAPALPLRMRSYVGPRTLAGWTRFLLKHAQGGDAIDADGGSGAKDEL